MSFQEAVTTVLTKKYVDFSGRSRRSEFWFYYLAYLLLSIVLNIVAKVIGTSLIGNLVFLAIFLPSLGVAVRRLHDTGRSGWWWLLSFTVIGLIPLVVWYAADSTPGANQYGPSPKDGEPLDQGVNPNWGQQG